MCGSAECRRWCIPLGIGWGWIHGVGRSYDPGAQHPLHPTPLRVDEIRRILDSRIQVKVGAINRGGAGELLRWAESASRFVGQGGASGSARQQRGRGS